MPLPEHLGHGSTQGVGQSNSMNLELILTSTYFQPLHVVQVGHCACASVETPTIRTNNATATVDSRL